ncbi:MAG TPA: MarR family winged helix-turn-helix transcriptional regulator [Chthoniobacterales bacterium]|nr:MarR family winged helix-turn-helix transcriptional regulator [Chthoniobacterales bacterium]
MAQKNDLNSQASRCSCTTLRKASRRISQLYDAALAPSGLKTTQRAILAQIRRSEATTVGNLAEALVIDAGALAHTLKPLERDGLISIGFCPAKSCFEAAMRVLPKPIGFRKAGVAGRCKFGDPITPVIGIDILHRSSPIRALFPCTRTVWARRLIL